MEPKVIYKPKLMEIEASSNVDFKNATDEAIALAFKAIPNISWFEVKGLGGRVKDGKRSEYRINFLVGV